MISIDYSKIAKAKEYYENLGYKYIEVPWLVDEATADVTKPSESNLHYVECGWNNEGALVGSGEQSFIQLMLDGKLSPGRYQAITPCFRDDEEDELHQQYFMKLELIDYMPENNIEAMNTLVDLADVYFDRFISTDLVRFQDEFDAEKDTYDIVAKKTRIELGSYGIRKYKEHIWSYGTGLALPRLDIAMEKEMRYRLRHVCEHCSYQTDSDMAMDRHEDGYCIGKPAKEKDEVKNATD